MDMEETKMLTKLTLSMLAVGMFAATATAEPLVLSDAELDEVNAGTFTTPGGQVIFPINTAGSSGNLPAAGSGTSLWDRLPNAGNNPVGPTHQ
jgi:hypothetical protein